MAMSNIVNDTIQNGIDVAGGSGYELDQNWEHMNNISCRCMT
jgi:hypothetical protein